MHSEARLQPAHIVLYVDEITEASFHASVAVGLACSELVLDRLDFNSSLLDALVDRIQFRSRILDRKTKLPTLVVHERLLALSVVVDGRGHAENCTRVLEYSVANRRLLVE